MDNEIVKRLLWTGLVAGTGALASVVAMRVSATDLAPDLQGGPARVSGAAPQPPPGPARTTAASASSSSTSPSASRRLVREEIELAKTEVTEKVTKLAQGRRDRRGRRVLRLLRRDPAHALFAYLLDDLFFEGDIWVGFLVEALLFFVVAGDRRLRRLPLLPGRRAAGAGDGDRGGQAHPPDARVGHHPRARQGAVAEMSKEPEIYRSGAGEPVARRAAPPPGRLGGDPRRHRAPARGARALGRGPSQPRHRAHRLAPPGPRAPPRADHRRGGGRLRRRRHGLPPPLARPVRRPSAYGSRRLLTGLT